MGRGFDPQAGKAQPGLVGHTAKPGFRANQHRLDQTAIPRGDRRSQRRRIARMDHRRCQRGQPIGSLEEIWKHREPSREPMNQS